MTHAIQVLQKSNTKGTNVFNKFQSYPFSEITYRMLMFLLNKQIIFIYYYD